MYHMYIDGKKIARGIESQLATRIAKLNQLGIIPKLVIIQVGHDKRSISFVKAKAKVGARIGVVVEIKQLPEQTPSRQLKSLIAKLNHNTDVHGIIVQLPLPQHLDADSIIDSIHPKKDVDGLSTVNRVALETGRELILPATPLGILMLLEKSQIAFVDKYVAIIGQGRLVGKPLYYMLKHRGARVVTANSKTLDLKTITRNADIIISATGQSGLITANMINSKAVIIDVGLSEVDNQLVGDVSIDAKNKARLATPVPGGVGPMTVVALMANVVTAAEMQTEMQK